MCEIGECAMESCYPSIEFNCVNIISFISEWGKNVAQVTGAEF